MKTVANRESLSARTSPEALAKAADMLKVVAHPVRLSMLDLLRDDQQMSVLAFQEKLKLPQAIASQHLILMQRRGILGSARVGKNKMYFIAQKEIINIVNCVEHCCIP
jgi:predicted transcriptional regulator